MTVRIFRYNGEIAFETLRELPHPKGKFIAGFAKDEEDAKARVMKYCGDIPVTFQRDL
jgi:predicted dinucleotide-binding enzyme